MALKFLNKKGWHTGSLRNIENVWKAEQKNEAEQRKLEELRKQIQEEREKDEFRLLQEQAGLTPRQERLEFLYDSGFAVGKTSSEGFKALETHPSEKGASASASASSASASAPSSSQQSATPGALFEEKPQSANDAWRKLHSDPLLMIRQREQEAMARIQNNPVKMAMIRKSMETKKKDDEVQDGERQKTKLKHKKHSSSKHHSESEEDIHDGEEKRKKEKHKRKENVDIDEESRDRTRHHRRSHRDYESEKHSSPLRQKADRNVEDSRGERTRYYKHAHSDREGEKQRHSSPLRQKADRNEDDSRGERTRHHRHAHNDRESEKRRHGSPSRQKADRREDLGGSNRSDDKSSKHEHLDQNSTLPPRPESHKCKGKAPQLSEEERAARLREMQMDAEIHEEQRWKRLKKAEEDDAREDSRSGGSRGRSFLDTMQKSVYGAEKGGSSTIEESVRRRTHFRQGRSEADERNAFRR